METSCRRGSVALGIGEKPVASMDIGTSGRHAAELVARMDEMLRQAGLTHQDVDELYVSVGPGSFTGLRVGITAARVWAQLRSDLKLVAVPTPLGIAENIAGDEWTHLAVLLAAKEKTVHATLIKKSDECFELCGKSVLVQPENLLDIFPTPLILAGEAIEFCGDEVAELLKNDGVLLADESKWMPTAEGVWHAGKKLAAAGEFTEFDLLVPVYARRPEAVRLWEKRQ